MKNKNIFIILAIALLAASCNPFAAPPSSGVVKSVNGGVDWQFSNTLSGSSAGSLSSVNVSKMDFDPHNRETVFAGTYANGLFKSTDSGASWTKVLSKIGVYDFAITPYDSKIIYVAGLYDNQGKVLKTTDGGASWLEKYNDPSADNAVRSLALNPQNPNQLAIGTSSGGVVLSSDGGISWKLLNNFNDKINRVLWQNGNIYVLLKSKGLYKSSDIGATFQNISDNLSNSSNLLKILQNSASGLVFNQAFVDTLTPSLMYVTTSMGLYKTADEGKTWNAVDLPVKKDSSGTRAIAVAKTSSNLVFTSVDSTIYKSTDGGASWQTQGVATSGFVNYILVDPQMPQIVYAGIYVSQ